jgi:hypothetical protein
MGSGRWTPDTYYDRAAARVAAGTDTFAYSRAAIESGQLKPHQTLDPMGLGIRQSRDNAEHPNSNAVIISLDVTGSMGRVCRGIHANLPQLHELLLANGCLPDPQVCFAAVGDATCDAVPFQIGQFESDNRMDENLEHMILEGGGGGQKTESYELMLYAAARHTATDCWDKRGRKGYLFIIGDETAYPSAYRGIVTKVFGGTPQADVPLKQLAAEAAERWHVFFVIPGGASYGRDPTIVRFWSDLLGSDHVIALQSPEQTSECIALTIAANEGEPDLPTAAVKGRGVVGSAIDAITGALFGDKPDPPRRHL